ncbi:hypothetical protein SLS55_002093 [Diplodia seriata]|uniref:Uncharacterized protein n=1 Tax=Diplodia seriata TaxID=420778 RepID=A0ABR3CR92_9PEZI
MKILSAGKGFHKTPFYAVFPPPGNPDIFTETREAAHALKRRAAGPSYAMAAMQGLADRVEAVIGILGRRLDGFCSAGVGEKGVNGQVVDLGAWLHFFAFDVLGEVAFGRPWGFLAEGRDVEGCIAAIDESQRYNGAVGQLPPLDWALRRNPVWRAWQAVVPGAQPLVTRIAREELGKRRIGGTGEGKTAAEGRDLLAQLLRAHEKDPVRFTEQDVFAVTHGAM